MPNEPDNLVLVQLREIRASLDAITRRLDEAEKRHEEVRGWVVHCLGLCTVQHLKNAEQDNRLTEQETRAKRLEELQEALRTRVYRLEERPT